MICQQVLAGLMAFVVSAPVPSFEHKPSEEVRFEMTPEFYELLPLEVRNELVALAMIFRADHEGMIDRIADAEGEVVADHARLQIWETFYVDMEHRLDREMKLYVGALEGDPEFGNRPMDKARESKWGVFAGGILVLVTAVISFGNRRQWRGFHGPPIFPTAVAGVMLAAFGGSIISYELDRHADANPTPTVDEFRDTLHRQWSLAREIIQDEMQKIQEEREGLKGSER